MDPKHPPLQMVPLTIGFSDVALHSLLPEPVKVLPTHTLILYLSSLNTSELLGGTKHQLLGDISAEVGTGFEVQVSASHTLELADR